MRISDIPGHQSVRRGLFHALARNRLPHAILIHGPAGVGKHALATALTGSLLCPQATPDACDACPSCHRLAQGNHPDLIRVEADGQFVKVDRVRTIVRQSYMRPFEGRCKVFLFPDADRFNDESANTLLKTLEEPSPHTYLILVTTSREAVLPTLRSRCQDIELRPLPRQDLRDRLMTNHGLSAEQADRRLARSGGSESVAMSLDIDALEASRARALRLLLSLADGQLDGELADQVIRLGEELGRKDAGFEPFLFDVLRPLARDALLLASGGSPTLAVDPPSADLHQLAATLGAAGADEFLSELVRAEDDLRVNANRKLLLEALLLGVFERAATRARSAAG